MKPQSLKTFFNKKDSKINAKLRKQCHSYKCCGSTYQVEILNSFNTELQLKNSESAIRNKLKDLLIELEVLKFMATLVLEFKKK